MLWKLLSDSVTPPPAGPPPDLSLRVTPISPAAARPKIRRQRFGLTPRLCRIRTGGRELVRNRAGQGALGHLPPHVQAADHGAVPRGSALLPARAPAPTCSGSTSAAPAAAPAPRPAPTAASSSRRSRDADGTPQRSATRSTSASACTAASAPRPAPTRRSRPAAPSATPSTSSTTCTTTNTSSRAWRTRYLRSNDYTYPNGMKAPKSVIDFIEAEAAGQSVPPPGGTARPDPQPALERQAGPPSQMEALPHG